jgi:PAS domain-containing protein/orotate phosphoribosyltransferase-like protein
MAGGWQGAIFAGAGHRTLISQELWQMTLSVPAKAPRGSMRSLSESPAKLLPKLPDGRAVETMERLAMLAAALCNAQSASVLLKFDGRSRVVAYHGPFLEYRSFAWDFAKVPFEPDERVLVEDLQTRPDLGDLPTFGREAKPRFFFRVPVLVEDGLVLSLVVSDPQPHQGPDVVDLALLDDLIRHMRDEFATVRDLLIDPQAHVTVALTMDALCERSRKSQLATIILDEHQTITFVNAAAELLIGAEARLLIGVKARDVAKSASDTMELLFRHALEQVLSTAEIEISVPSPVAGQRTFGIMASPFSPIGTDDYFLQVVIREVTELVRREDDLEHKITSHTSAAKDVNARQSDPTGQFLLDTLVQRRGLRSRNGITYLTLRSWRNPIREYQIKALQAIKTSPSEVFVAQIASEIEGAVSSLMGLSVFKAIVPVPCGHSADDSCLSVAIARRLGKELELPVINALTTKKRRGKSHPKANVSRPALVLKHAISEAVLLVDDVATSGAHLEEAVKLLKSTAGAVMPVAWIGGNVAGKADDDEA